MDKALLEESTQRVLLSGIFLLGMRA